MAPGPLPAPSPAPEAAPGSALRRIWRQRRYRQLLGTRLASQAGDGFFQAGLASLVLFNAEQQASPGLVAAALAVAVLPFTLVGPFAGVLLDRWPRQRVLLLANPVRALLALGCLALVLGTGVAELAGPGVGALYALVLAALTVNRFLLAGLGASLPHAVAQDLLVPANAATPTLGTGAFAAGLAAGGAYRALVGGGPGTDATLLAVAALAWCASAALASRIPRDSLGPDERTEVSAGTAARAALAGLREGAAHLWARPSPRDGLGAMVVHRFAFGVLTIATLVLARERLTDSADAAVGVLVAVGGAAAAGALLAAVVTPVAGRWLGLHRWVVACLLAAGAAVAVLAVGVSIAVLVAVGLVVALAGQGVKIAVDTLVQTGVDDAHRGRAFAFYDVSYNAAFVGAAAVAALVVPPDGYARWLFAALAAWYALGAVVYGTAAGPRARARQGVAREAAGHG